MATHIDTARREVVLVEQTHVRPMMGLGILEPLPSAPIPYPAMDPYNLVHETVVSTTQRAALAVDDTQPGTRIRPRGREAVRRAARLQRTFVD